MPRFGENAAILLGPLPSNYPLDALVCGALARGRLFFACFESVGTDCLFAIRFDVDGLSPYALDVKYGY